jgi:hypothetical protein
VTYPNIQNFELPDIERRIADPNFKLPDLVGTVEGWRAWQVDEQLPRFGVAPKLKSCVWDYFWAPRKAMRAECGVNGKENSDHTPGEDCTCGFHAAKNAEHLLTQMGYHNYHGGGYFKVLGRVAHWGKCVEGTLGWRAEWAYPVELYVPFEYHRFRKPLMEAYGVPVKLLNFLKPYQELASEIDDTPITAADREKYHLGQVDDEDE